MEFQNIYHKKFMIDDYSFSEQYSLFIILSGLNTIIHYSEPFCSHYSKFVIHPRKWMRPDGNRHAFARRPVQWSETAEIYTFTAITSKPSNLKSLSFLK